MASIGITERACEVATRVSEVEAPERDRLHEMLAAAYRRSEQKRREEDTREELARWSKIDEAEEGLRAVHEMLREAGVRDPRCYLMAGMEVARRLGVDEVVERVSRRAELRSARLQVQAAQLRRTLAAPPRQASEVRTSRPVSVELSGGLVHAPPATTPTQNLHR